MHTVLTCITLKGKDMILADYLSRNRNEDEDPTDLIPVSFCKIRDIEDLCVATRASVKASGETVPEVHWSGQRIRPTHHARAAIC